MSTSDISVSDESFSEETLPDNIYLYVSYIYDMKISSINLMYKNS